MAKLVLSSFAELEAYVGKELGVSAPHEITQEQINKFAEATLDHQWIHTDPARAAKESPFGTTIAHGYLTLSMAPLPTFPDFRTKKYQNGNQLRDGKTTIPGSGESRF